MRAIAPVDRLDLVAGLDESAADRVGERDVPCAVDGLPAALARTPERAEDPVDVPPPDALACAVVGRRADPVCPSVPATGRPFDEAREVGALDLAGVEA
jgi:hypothetical protein